MENTRSRHPEVFCEKGVLRNFSKFTGKHLCQSLFFGKVAGLRPATLLKEKLSHRCFPANFEKFLRIPFLTEHLWWLFLKTQRIFFFNLALLKRFKNCFWIKMHTDGKLSYKIKLVIDWIHFLYMQWVYKQIALES